MKNKGIWSLELHKYKAGEVMAVSDSMAIEEPLEISLMYWIEGKKTKKNISITMRTPGNDEELAVGFLFTEGILHTPDQIEKVMPIGANELCVEIKKEVDLNLSKLDRNFYTTSSCGVCGKSSIDSIRTVVNKNYGSDAMKVAVQKILQLNNRVKEEQKIFESTGGLHASALFTSDGEFLDLREDVGRHNALDKLIGSRFMQNQIPLQNQILFLSGRASFELIQKAAMADLTFICALGAPSSLAVELAREFGMVLIGFVKENSFNVYNGNERIVY